jgi:cell division protein FtsA
LKHTVVIPIAGVNITNDIRQGLGVLRTQAEQMKVKFGMALADEAQSNAYITIPGLKGQPQKEISAKNLANIIQSRMEEILEYVMYHIKQMNLQDKLHGGIILTGGGSQLKHIMQLTEFKTGMPARLGLPNEHLSVGYIPELMKPMYATCIGLILRGYDDFESNRLRFISNNSEESLANNDEIEGTFVTMTKTFEASPQELLNMEFGETPETSATDFFSSDNQHQEMQSSLDGAVQQNEQGQAEATLNTEMPEAKQLGKNRAELVNSIFKTVKSKVMYWFENVDDEKLDNG